MARHARVSARERLRDRPRFVVDQVSAARTSADPLSAILLSLGLISVTRRSDLFRTRDSDRARTYSAARASILLAASVGLAIEGSAAA